MHHPQLRTRTIRHTFHILALLLVCMLVGGPALTPRVYAAGTVTVTTLSDEKADNSTCSLREALQAINVPAQPFNNDCGAIPSDPVTIVFSVSGTLTLNNAPSPPGDSASFGTLPFIVRNIAISGPVTINGNDQTIFRIQTNGTLSLANMTITNGDTAIFMNGGALNVAGVAFINNKSQSDGGAIGGLTGAVNVAGSTFNGNEAEGIDGGGAIYLRGSNLLQIAGSSFNGNIAKRSGGAIYALAPTTITDTVFNGNIANALDPNNNGTDGDPADSYDAFGGGAVFALNDSTDGRKMVITRAVFNGNLTGKGFGGALYNNSGSTMEIYDSAFSGNLAGLPSNERSGGAIKNFGGAMRIVRSSLVNNAVIGDGGGVSNDRGGQLTMGNVTLNGNKASINGGAIVNLNTQTGSDIRPRLLGINLTIAQNDADSAGGGIYAQAPSSSHPDVVLLQNSIVTGSDGPGFGGNCVGGGVQSLGNNLDSGASCGFTQAGDLQNTNQALAAPTFNGGVIAQLLTQELNAGSPAADGGNNIACNADPIAGVDARGFIRPKGAGCDIGAYEAEPPAAGFGATLVQPGPIDFGNVTFGQNQNKTLTVFNTGNIPLALSEPQISGADSTDFALLTNFPVNVDLIAPAAIQLRCAPGGTTPGLRTAVLSFKTTDPAQPTVGYTLICNAVAQPVPGFGSTPAAPGPLDFGAVVVGTTKGAQIVVQENGTATLNVNTAVLGGANPGDFAVGAVNLSLPNGSVPTNINVSCTPTATGIRSATLRVNTNDPTKPQVTFNLSCTGRVAPTPPLIDDGDTYTGGILGMDRPYGLAMTPDGSKVIVAAMSGDADGGADPEGTLSLFSRNPTTGALTLVSALTDPDDHLRGAIRLIVSPDGNYLYVSAYNNNPVSITPTTTDGRVIAYRILENSLVKIDTVAEGSGYGICNPGCQAINTLGGAYGLAISPDGRYLYITSAADSRIVVLRIDSDGGISLGPLRFPAQQFSDSALINPYDIVLSPDGAYAYVASYHDGGTSDNIAVFARNGQTGDLGPRVQTINRSQLLALSGVFRLTLSPDGTTLYAASYDSDSVTVFQRNPADGKLSHPQTFTNTVNGVTGLDAASAVAVSPDGKYVFATGFNNDAVVSFERNTQSGELIYIDPPITNTALNGARDIVVSPDRRHVYVTGFNANQISMLPFANPIPAMESLAPASATAGTANLSLTIKGSNFVPGATVRWTGVGVVVFGAEFISSSELRIDVGGVLLANTGVASVRVINPEPGGGLAPSTLTFTINAPASNPTPAVSELIPASAPAGASGPTITVKGAGFIAGSVVRWNGANRVTTYISPTTLQATLLTSDVAQPGANAVTVFNPTPGGGGSNALGFEVAGPGENPVPALTNLSPASILAGANGSLDLIISGSGFIEGLQGRLNGNARPTQFINSTTIKISLSGADLVTPATASIDVVNPSPGGGASNALGFEIVAPGVNLTPSVSGIAAIVFNANGTRTVTIAGAGFVTGAQVQWNGATLPTTFISGGALQVTVDAAAFNSLVVIAVVNPPPGGGPSNELLYRPPRLNLPLVAR